MLQGYNVYSKKECELCMAQVFQLYLMMLKVH